MPPGEEFDRHRAVDKHEYTLYGPDGNSGLLKSHSELKQQFEEFRQKVMGAFNKIVGGLTVIAILWAVLEVFANIYIRIKGVHL